MNIYEFYFKEIATKKEKRMKLLSDLLNNKLSISIFVGSLFCFLLFGFFSFLNLFHDIENTFEPLVAITSAIICLIFVITSYFDNKFNKDLFLKNPYFLHFLQDILLTRFNFNLKEHLDNTAKDEKNIYDILFFIHKNLEDKKFTINPFNKEIFWFNKCYSFKSLDLIVENKYILISALASINTYCKEFKQKNIFESKVKHLKKQEDLRNFSKLLE